MASVVSRYFNDNEFKRASPACSLSDMHPKLLESLDYARALSGIPFIINSAYRSKSYEVSMGRTGSSSHCKGLAVDLRCDSDSKRLIMIKSLLRAGFRRIGVYKTFIHADIDLDKPECIWLG